MTATPCPADPRSARKRILHVGEASYLNSGYSVYSHEVNRRLFASGDFEVAELACFDNTSDPRRAEVPWRLYSNTPASDAELPLFSADHLNKEGKWRFNHALLDFKPDVVWSVRDPWVDRFIAESPFRRYFRWVCMPTVDAAPLKDFWLKTIMDADGVFAYSDWGADVLRDEGGGLVRLLGTASPAADYDTFRPLEQGPVRAHLGVPEDAFVVGTVMRNNPRKLFPELVAAFREFLDVADPGIRGKSFLYLHTTYPEQGNHWDIPGLIKNSGISHKILVTYSCRKCRHFWASRFRDARSYCPACGEPQAGMVNVRNGVPPAALAAVYNAFDVYVQYANCLKPGTLVHLERGWVPVEDVVVGDTAFTHRGRFRKVVQVFAHRGGDRPLDISVWGEYETLTITSDHPVYAITRKDCVLLKERSLRETIGRLIGLGQTPPSPGFVRACQLRTGDMIALPIDDAVEDVTEIDFAPHAKDRDTVYDDTVVSINGVEYVRRTKVDNEFCRFLGLYVADGHAGSTGTSTKVQITSNTKDSTNHALAVSVLARFGRAVKEIPYVGRRAIDARIHNRLLSDYLSKECGKLTEKRLPQWCLSLPKEKQQEILRGLFMGDGCYYAKRKVSIYCTTSSTLAFQIKTLLRRLRVNYSSHIRSRGGTRQDVFAFEVYGNVVEWDFSTKRKKTANTYHGNYHLLQVKLVAPSSYDGPVCNFEVEEDNSYTTRLGSVHNSEGFGLPMVEAAACGVPVFATDYSAMSDVVRKLGGHPLRVASLVEEVASGVLRAIPERADLVAALLAWLPLPPDAKRQWRLSTAEAARGQYSWEGTVKKWAAAFQAMPPSPPWDEPARTIIPAPLPPEFPTYESFVRWAIVCHLGRPDLVGSFLETQTVRDLNWGTKVTPEGGIPYDEQSVLREFAEIRENFNQWEARRVASCRLSN